MLGLHLGHIQLYVYCQQCINMRIEIGEYNYYLNGMYTSFYVYLTSLLAIITAIKYSFSSSPFDRIVLYRKYNGYLPTIILAFGIVLFFGMATRYGIFIGDTILYEWSFRHIDYSTTFLPIFGHETMFDNLQILVYKLGGKHYSYFASLVAFIYISTIFWTSHRLMKDNIWMAMVFFVTSFSFFGYGTNGVRNGLACHLVILGICYLSDTKTIKCLFLFVFAYLVHRSTLLPIVCSLFAILIDCKPKHAIVFWMVSIVLSLLIGNYVENFFMSFGFDDRFERYIQGQENIEQMTNVFSAVGFRWDFLLYSAAPILFIWYLTVKRNFEDKTYNIFSTVYILSNAFWILVIRASYSNRFAYLSWFLYPLIIAYPLIRFNIWDNQSRKTAIILLAYSFFSLFMYIIGK